MSTHNRSSLVVSDSFQIKCIDVVSPTPHTLLAKIDIPSEWCHLKHDLIRQLQLHIHRFNTTDITPYNLKREVVRIINKLVSLRKGVPEELHHPINSVELSRTTLDIVDSSIAHILHQSYHYLGSPRKESIHLGLYAEDFTTRNTRLLAIATLSPFDLKHIEDALPLSIKSDQVLVLSRLFAFDWCPRNTVSYTLGRVFNWLREQFPHIELLLTYLDPNLGFEGTVYKATNWTLLGREKKSPYLYLDSEYVTTRRMIQLYGTADFAKLKIKLVNRISASTRPLRPLEIYGYFLDTALRKKSVNLATYDFAPDSTLVGAIR
jgi:hypothetical protein